MHVAISSVIAALICLVGCSKNPVPDAAREPVTTKIGQEEAKLPFSLERVMVPVTNSQTTGILFRRTSPPPWRDGNYLTFYFRKPAVPGQPEEWASWKVANIHTENFGEITHRLGLKAVEVSVLHTAKSSIRIRPAHGPERAAIQDECYAVITDIRIPREWLRTVPGADRATATDLHAAYPRSFRADE